MSRTLQTVFYYGIVQLDKCFVWIAPDVLFFFFLGSCQASEDVKNRRQQGFVDFSDVYLNYYAVAAKRSTYFFFLKKKRSEFELCRKNTLDITFPLYIWIKQNETKQNGQSRSLSFAYNKDLHLDFAGFSYSWTTLVSFHIFLIACCAASSAVGQCLLRCPSRDVLVSSFTLCNQQ